MSLIKPNSEDALQAQCIRYMRLQHPKVVCFAIANGGSRHRLEAIKLKMTGVTAGVPDLFIATPKAGYSGLFVELKSKKGRLTESQKIMIKSLREVGYKVEVIRSLEEFIQLIFNYLMDWTASPNLTENGNFKCKTEDNLFKKGG